MREDWRGALPLLVASGTGTRTPPPSCCQGDGEHQARLPCPGRTRRAAETREKRVPSAQPPALLLVGKFPAVGRGRKWGEGGAQKPQRLRLAGRLLSCLRPLTPSCPPALEGHSAPSAPLWSTHCVCFTSGPFVCFSVSRCGPPPPGLGCHHLVSGRLSSLLWAQHTKPSGERCRELLVRSALPHPPSGDHTPPTLPSPHFCLRSQLLAHQLLTLTHLFSSPPNRGQPQGSEPLPPEGPPGLRHAAPEC